MAYGDWVPCDVYLNASRNVSSSLCDDDDDALKASKSLFKSRVWSEVSVYENVKGEIGMEGFRTNEGEEGGSLWLSGAVCATYNCFFLIIWQ